jgi:hypothetical protein
MTINEYLNGRTITAVEIIQDLIFNIFIGEEVMGLDIDTSSIPSGSVLQYRTDFVINGDLLTVDNITINMNETNVLYQEPENQDNQGN